MMFSQPLQWCTAIAALAAIPLNAVPAASKQLSYSNDGKNDSRVPSLKLDQPTWLPLTGDQIREAVSGRVLQHDIDYRPFPGVKVKSIFLGGCPPQETFSSDGGWTREACFRVATVFSGRWTTEKFRGGERLCVEAPKFKRLCRFVWKGAAENQFFMAADSPLLEEQQGDPRTFNSYRLVAIRR